jgi:N-acyl-D-amino-acid deacylase
LEEAIRRMTSLPANKFNLVERGMIKEGYIADIVVFDEENESGRDASTYDNPHQYAKGFKYVLSKWCSNH